MSEFEIIHGDCLRNLCPADMIFADPPDNIGLQYNGYSDSMPDAQYIGLFRVWIQAFCDASPVVWVSFNPRWLLPVARIFSEISFNMGLNFRPCVQTFTFYQNNKNGLGTAHRPLWRLSRPEAPEYPQAIKIPSWRQINGDKRAADGKIPGDSFDQMVEVDDSFFDFSRVTGNSKQRRKWHRTQLNEELVERCIKLNTLEGDFVLDPFAGTGTTLRVCKRINRRCRLIEVSKEYVTRLREEHKC